VLVLQLTSSWQKDIQWRTFDPSTERWSEPSWLSSAERFTPLAPLPDGNFLLFGGVWASTPDWVQTLPTSSRPRPRHLPLLSAPPEPRHQHTLTLLRDGRVLLTGGSIGYNQRREPTPYLLDATQGTWQQAAPERDVRLNASATLLLDGRVLVTGGQGSTPDTLLGTRVAELYDPVKDTWTSAAPMAQARHWHTSTLLPDGRVLVIGRGSGAELYEPTTDRWSPADVGGLWGTATVLPSGRVLIAGGNGSEHKAVLYDPGTNTHVALPPLLQAHREGAQARLLPDGRVLLSDKEKSELFDEGNRQGAAPVLERGMAGPGEVLRLRAGCTPSGAMLERPDGALVPLPLTVDAAGAVSVRLPDALGMGWHWLRTTRDGWVSAAAPLRIGVPQGQACSSGAECTTGFCADGVCCDQACDEGVCDACSRRAGGAEDGTCTGFTARACDDGDACTQQDRCEAGACVGAQPTTCFAPGDHPATCVSSTGACIYAEGPQRVGGSNTPESLEWARQAMLLGGEGHDTLVAALPAGTGHMVLVGLYREQAMVAGVELPDHGRQEQCHEDVPDCFVRAEDLFIAKLRTNGSPAWVRSFGAPGQYVSASAATVAPDGDVLVLASAPSAVSFGEGPETGQGEQLLVRFSPEGTHRWTRRFHCPQGVFSHVRVDGQGHLYLAGWFRGECTLGTQTLRASESDLLVASLSAEGALRWAHVRDAPESPALIAGLEPAADGTVWVGTTLREPPQKRGLPSRAYPVLFRLDAQGEPLWQWTLPGSHPASLTRFVRGGDGGLVLLGEFSGSLEAPDAPLHSEGERDVFVARLDTTGRLVWVRRLGGRLQDSASVLAIGAGGDVFLGGQADMAWEGSFFVARLDGSDGWLHWARHTSLQAGVAGGFSHLLPLASGEVMAMGWLHGTARFGPLEVQARPHERQADLFLLRLAP
jgi:outer membrane protein assembly factor BamB